MKYNVEVPLAGSIFFKEIEADSADEAINMCRGLLTTGAGHENKIILWSRGQAVSLAPVKKIDWAQWDRLLGKMPDTKIAKMAGVSHTTVRKRRESLGKTATQPKTPIDWTQWDHLIGHISDTNLAKKIGCDRSTVTERRIKMNIPAFFVTKIDWTKWDARIDTEPDADLARKIGCSVDAVRLRRLKLEKE